MRALLAATAVAAAPVLVPIQARLEPLASVEIETDANASPQTTAAQSDQTPQDAALDSVEPAPSVLVSGSDPEKQSNAVAGSVPPPPATVEATADAICATLDRSASQNNLPLDFFTRLIWQESRFNPLSVSHAGAQGIAQFMPGTARLVGLANPFDPIQALRKSAELLRELRTQFGNLGLAAAAYNAGPKRVEDWLAKRRILPQETETYVRIITGRSAQEWTGVDAGNWSVTPAAPRPCEQLAKPAPHRVQPVIAIHRTDHPAHTIVVARQPDRSAAAAHDRPKAASSQPDRSTAAAHQPAPAVKLAHVASNAAAASKAASPRSDRSATAAHQPAPGVKLAHVASNAAAAPKTASPRSGRSEAAAHQPAPGVKLAHVASNAAAPKTASPRSDRSATAAHQPAPGVKLAHVASNDAAKNIPAPKSIIAAPKSTPHAHPAGSSSVHGSAAEASHALRREQPAAPHRRAAPSPRAARLA
ncbi:MAG TPA: transglycosylase SLT domain-containing protein [Xanthobacteraceae bacterium]